MLPLLIAFSLALATTAGFAARAFVSPTQRAAQARAPAMSVITAPVTYGVIPLEVVFRGKITHGDIAHIPPPSGIADSPVVTSVHVRNGQRMSDGELLGTIAEEPVFVMAGRVPAFRDIRLGTRGVDVHQLQVGLVAAGYDTGSDPKGFYGAGTAAAVARMYHKAGVQPDIQSGARRVVHIRQAALTHAKHLAIRADARLASEIARRSVRAKIMDDRRAANSAQSALHIAGVELAQAKRAAEPMIPDGGVAFVPRLPAEVLSVAKLGATIGEAGSSNAPGIATIGLGSLTLNASVSAATAAALRLGLQASVSSPDSGDRLRARVIRIRPGRVALRPIGKTPPGMIGRNLQVVVVERRTKSLIVPVAALNTNVVGVYVTAVRRSGKRERVPVKLGPASGGRQAVTPIRGKLHAGEQLVIGRQARLYPDRSR